MVYGLLFMVYSLGLHYRYTIVIYEEYDRYLLECGEAVGAEHLRPLVAVVPGGRGRAMGGVREIRALADKVSGLPLCIYIFVC